MELKQNFKSFLCSILRVLYIDIKEYIWYSRDPVGANGGEGTPVPIPNTEVKLTRVENTWLETAWEDRTVPTQKKTD